jgi:hypothetical protein
MAAPSKTPKEATELFTTDDIAAALTSEDESISLDNPFTPDGEVPSEDDVTLASILDTDIDPEELERKESALVLQSGNYTWVGEVQVNFSYNDADKATTDIAQRKGFNKGRMIWNISGQVQEKESKKKGRFNFTCSPDARKAKDSADDDFFSKNYALVTNAFFKVMERIPKKESEVVAFIQKKQYSMYVTLSRTGSNFLNRVNKL